jgi:hypothetical protein
MTPTPSPPLPVIGRRPRNGTTSSDLVRLRITPSERATWTKAAGKAKVTLSEWIRERCNLATAKRRPKKPVVL